ncbi:hypothetical protein SMACR_06544 [Sordaria macrospora]|uniref:WGS project CABT00000000 data, contig 2.28 n=2 Tax=Sordaria macrospora TaxID=5147 RepID=F7W4M7_SORMK|nr:uncharacterized protein SMAC_06544 [Sordaria macrospora k-hell]KAA8633715.1 hypothetical protein SMACR_06544 [Sordaria macrospora]WPJ60115.1 hypothetical protein SMAC4_06544 [Sordaria macrospora]CCC12464.1 unnamed protein product [Sordaria macrospora k-hell]
MGRAPALPLALAAHDRKVLSSTFLEMERTAVLRASTPRSAPPTLVVVKLLATQSDIPNLHIGKLVTIWTGFVGKNSIIQVPFVSMIVPVHPGPASQSCIKFHQEGSNPEETGFCRVPLEYDTGSPASEMPGLISLKALMKGTQTHEKNDNDTLTRVLVCVSSVGPRKTIKTNNKPGTLDLVEVHVCDKTDHYVIRLWSDQIVSARE